MSLSSKKMIASLCLYLIRHQRIHKKKNGPRAVENFHWNSHFLTQQNAPSMRCKGIENRCHYFVELPVFIQKLKEHHRESSQCMTFHYIHLVKLHVYILRFSLCHKSRLFLHKVSEFLSEILHKFSKRIPKILNVPKGQIKLVQFYQNETTKHLQKKGPIQTRSVFKLDPRQTICFKPTKRH